MPNLNTPTIRGRYPSPWNPHSQGSKDVQFFLEEFGEASRAEINHSKSMIYFFNTNPAIQRNLTNMLRFEWKTLPMKYLGVPLIDKECRNITWEGVIKKMQERVKNWTYRTLNLVGWLILTKVILQAISVYLNSKRHPTKN